MIEVVGIWIVGILIGLILMDVIRVLFVLLLVKWDGLDEVLHGYEHYGCEKEEK